MSASQPPRLASWLLHHLASSPQRESLAGDLIERYHQGRSATWYWRQVLAAILAGVIRDIRDMDLHIKRVWLPGAASCLLFFGFYWILILLPFDKNRFQFISIPYLVLPLVGALGAYLSRRMKGSVLERIVSALFPVFAFVALFAVGIVYGLFFEGKPYTLPHFLSGLSVTLVFIGVGGLLLLLGAWPFCRPHLREQSPTLTGHWSQEGPEQDRRRGREG
jgi:hypothetical protein